MSESESGSDAVLRRFREAVPRFERAREGVLAILKEILAAAGIDATLTARVKDIDSFRGKLELRTDYADPWKQITDKIGARAIVHRADAVDQIHQLIETNGRLRIYDITDKRKLLGEKELGYSGLHLVVYAPAEEGDTEEVPVELQIRTIAQHAWSEVSHKLLYKPQIELDDADRRAIWRLVAWSRSSTARSAASSTTCQARASQPPRPKRRPTWSAWSQRTTPSSRKTPDSVS